MRVKYYLTLSGRSPVEEFISKQSLELRSKYFDAIDLLAEGRILDMPLSRNLSSIYHGLYELRLKDNTGQVRIFYFIKKLDAIYMLHAFKKKKQELPKNEISIALKRIREV